MWGSRRFITSDTSTNSFWVAILTFGEGWHNNHHAAPQAARHGLAWYEVDMNWYGICVLRALGLAADRALRQESKWRTLSLAMFSRAPRWSPPGASKCGACT